MFKIRKSKHRTDHHRIYAARATGLLRPFCCWCRWIFRHIYRIISSSQQANHFHFTASQIELQINTWTDTTPRITSSLLTFARVWCVFNVNKSHIYAQTHICPIKISCPLFVGAVIGSVMYDFMLTIERLVCLLNDEHHKSILIGLCVRLNSAYWKWWIVMWLSLQSLNWVEIRHHNTRTKHFG